MPTNSVDFFRFNDGYEDVFVSKDGQSYLYAEAEPLGWAHLLACRVWTPHKPDVPFIRPIWTSKVSRSEDPIGYTADYLSKLDPAPENIAEQIIENEHRITQRLLEKFDENEYTE